jgi:alpha-L-fucosidase
VERPATESGVPSGATGPVWWPAECDTSIRPGWFWHRSEDERVKPLDQLLDIYFHSVGRNSVLLLNVPPNDRGRIAEPDILRLRQFRRALDDAFAADRAANRPATSDAPAARGHDPAHAVDGDPATYWAPREASYPASLEIDLGAPTTFNIALAQEQIAEGQHVEAYRIDAWTGGRWDPVAQGTTIGHKKLDRFPAVTASRVRLTALRSRERPCIRRFALFHAPHLSSSPPAA